MKIVATRCQIIWLNSISVGLCPRPRWAAYSAPQTSPEFKGSLLLRGGETMEETGERA